MRTFSPAHIALNWKTYPLFLCFFLLSLLYELIVSLRLFLYEKGIFRGYRSNVPVISIGNLSAGGSGKTPMTDFLATQLTEHQITFAILSRGYKRESQSTVSRYCALEDPFRTSQQIGDEPYLLAQKHPNVPVYVGRQRSQSARLCELWESVQMLLLDDAYQHLAIHRDLNLLLIDAATDLDQFQLLPLGHLREPLAQWRRASAIVITKSNLGFSDRLDYQLRKELHVSCPIFKFDYQIHSFSSVGGNDTILLENWIHPQVFLLCGVANPTGVKQTMEQAGIQIYNQLFLPDHVNYSSPSLQQQIQKKLHRLPQNVVCLTTEKDAIKLKEYPELAEKIWCVEMKVVPDPQWEEFLIDFLRKFSLI